MRILAILAALVSFAFAPPLYARQATDDHAPSPATALFSREVDGDHGMGNPQAPVIVIQYGSVACPICARVNAQFLPTFKAKYVDTGKVRYIYRPMMTGNVAVAASGHLLAQCAGNDKYFAVIDAIMRRQDEMDQGGPPEQYSNARQVLLDIAHSVGLNEDQFDTCITNVKGIEALNDINDQALRAGVDATPTFFVNGRKLMLRTGDIADLSQDFATALQPMLP